MNTKPSRLANLVSQRVLPICGALLLASHIAAQSVSMSGQVVDPQGKPMDGVLVRLLGADLWTLTGSDGRWTIEEGTPKALFPRRLQSPSQLSWAGPGQPVVTQFQTKTGLTVLLFDEKGEQLVHRHAQLEAGAGSVDLGQIPAGAVLVSLQSQAIDRVVYRLPAGAGERKPVLIFSTCGGASPGANPAMDILSVEHPRFAPGRVVLKGYDGAGAAGAAKVALAALPKVEYHVDAAKGSDSAAGTAAAPLKTLAAIRPKLKGGETVWLHDGEYGAISETTDTGFTWWVTFAAAPGAKPVVDRIRLEDQGVNNWDGEHDMRIRYEGLRIKDGVALRGMRWIEINGCVINREGELNGSLDNIEKKAGVGARNSRSLRVEGCDITHVATGIGVSGNHHIVRRNDIHHNSHDGLGYTGGHDFLVEYNAIHDLEDGADDSEKKNWNRHVDCIQMYPWYDNDEPTNWIADITLRGNHLYRPESMAWMFNAKSPRQYRRFLIENNVTAAVPGYLFHFKESTDGCVIRHNSFLLPDAGFQYKGIFGRDFNTKPGNNWVAIPSMDWAKQSRDVEFYGNILGAGVDIDGGPEKTRCDNNVYYSSSGKTQRKNPLGVGEVVVGEQPYIDVTKLDGVLNPKSAVATGGMKPIPGPRGEIPPPAYDFTGAPRTAGKLCPGAVEPR